MLLLPEGLHDTDAVDRLVNDLDDVALTLLRVPGGGKDPPAHPVGNQQQGGGHEEADDRQQGREVKHDANGHQHHQHVPAHDGQKGEQALDKCGVGIGARHELAGGHPVKIAGVHELQMLLHVVAQIVLHRKRNPPAVVAAQIGEGERRHPQQDQQGKPWPQRRRRDEDDVVHDLPRDQWDENLGRAAEYRGT